MISFSITIILTNIIFILVNIICRNKQRGQEHDYILYRQSACQLMLRTFIMIIVISVYKVRQVGQHCNYDVRWCTRVSTNKLSLTWLPQGKLTHITCECRMLTYLRQTSSIAQSMATLHIELCIVNFIFFITVVLCQAKVIVLYEKCK